MSKLLRRIFAALVGVLIVGGAMVWLIGGFAERIPPGESEPAAMQRPPNAAEAQVERVTGPVSAWASGAVASSRRTVIASRILARIAEIRVRAGDVVAKGDAVVTLEAQDLQARVAQSRDALTAAQARLDLAQAEKTRFQALVQRGVASKQRYDQAVSELQSAKADVARLKQNVKETQTQLSFAQIESPVSGRVVDRLAEPGDTATPGQPLLKIYDPTSLRVEAPVRETLAVRLRVGDELRVEVPSINKKFQGAVEEIVPFAEPGARTLLIKVGLPLDPELTSGMFARIAVPAGERERLLVPAVAVERIGQLEFVTVVDKNGKLERRMVTTGDYRDNGRVEVLSGLDEGEQVIYADAAPS